MCSRSMITTERYCRKGCKKLDIDKAGGKEYSEWVEYSLFIYNNLRLGGLLQIGISTKTDSPKPIRYRWQKQLPEADSPV